MGCGPMASVTFSESGAGGLQVRRWSVPEIRPSQGAIYAMAIVVGTFTYFFVRPRPDEDTEQNQVAPSAPASISRRP
jgi:hypothetical protein